MKPTPRWLEGAGPDDVALRSALQDARRGPSAAQLSALSANLAARMAARELAPRPKSRPRRLGLVVGAALVLLGVGLVARLATPAARPEPVARLSPSEQRAPSAALPKAPAPPAAEGPSREPTQVEPVAPTAAHVAPRAAEQPSRRKLKAPRPGPLGDELALLQAASRALLAEPARALQLAREHEAKFAQGIFGEEREAIAIEALLKLRRLGEANARRQRFDQRFPSSTYRQRLDRVRGDSAGAL